MTPITIFDKFKTKLEKLKYRENTYITPIKLAITIRDFLTALLSNLPVVNKIK